MDANATIDAVVGLFMPAVIALVNQPRWSPRVKGLVAFVACLLAAVIVEAWRGNIEDWAQWRDTSVIIFGAALVTYQTWWKPAQLAPAIERATSPKPARNIPPKRVDDIEPPPDGEL